MTNEILCCADARLDGFVLSGRQAGAGSIWELDLRQVTQARFVEWHGPRRLRYILWLHGAEGWRHVAVGSARAQKAKSRELAEHLALCAAVAERMEQAHPGFRLIYETRGISRFVAVLRRLGALAVAGLAVPLFWMPPAAHVWAVPGVAVGAAGAALAGLAVARSLRRRTPDVSAVALPGILTALSQRN